MEERIKVWDGVVSRELDLPLPLKEPKPYHRIEPNNTEATFEQNGATWTIMGANAPIVNPDIYPKNWPLKGNNFEVLTISEPVTNYRILPFTENIENAIKSDTLSITAARDSYEPTSFVIRTGDSPLKNIGIEIDDLKMEINDRQGNASYQSLPKSLIDIRVVKCWYQAGIAISDATHKVLVPELLLHDDDVVRVDYAGQVNMIRNHKELVDSENLQPFSIPARQNKQIWLTIHITKDIQPGEYKGLLKIKSDTRSQAVNLNIRVLPFILPTPVLDYALYYEGHLADSDDKPKVTWLIKTATQMKAELEDMIAHGLTNAPVWHQIDQDKAQWEKDWVRLRKTLDIRNELGWGNQPLLYLDWKVSLKENHDLYKEKIKEILSVAQEKGIKEVYIYGVDEKIGEELAQLKPLYKTVHEEGAKNFVAGQLKHFLKYADSLIDLMVVTGPHSDAKVKQILTAKHQGNKVLSYANPIAGLEEAATYHQNYGINLYLSGANGTLNFNYQAGSWNDWISKTGVGRPHVMAYPTVDKPISTLQWEGWREGINDVRFLSLALQINKFDSHSLVGKSPKRQRELLLKYILSNSG